MKKLIKRREIPAGNPVSDNALLDRLYRSRHIKNSQELDRTLQSMLNPNHYVRLKSYTTYSSNQFPH